MEIASLAFPTGRTPGFNPSHPASFGISAGHGCSIIATGNGGAVNIINGLVGTLVGTVSGAIHGAIGPSCSFASSANNARSFAGNAAVKDDNNTVACICVPQTAFTNLNGFFASGNLWGVQLGFNGSGRWQLYPAGQSTIDATSIPAAVLDTPYFAAISSSLSATNFVVTNLSTGKVYSQSATAPSTLGGTPSGTYRLGGGLNTAISQPGLVSHAMFAPSYMSISQLRQWAADPWSFWYPK